jgi:hypothetical protein
MTQSYVMQLHWTEEAMRRAQTEPRVESYDYREWKEGRKAEAKANQWETGHWDIPYQHQAEARQGRPSRVGPSITSAQPRLKVYERDWPGY